MLPSTGNFKEFSCPFFDSGLCERPYCHFRHVKKEMSDNLPQVASSLSLEDNGEMLQQLVSEAVKKVLQQTEILPGALGSSTDCNPVESVSQSLVTKVVEKLTPPLTVTSNSPKCSEGEDIHTKAPSYKPTPISVLLKKRHIPIPYSPTPSKNTNLVLKRRNCDPSSSHKRAKFEEYDPSVSTTDKGGGEALTQYSPTVIHDGTKPSASYTPSTMLLHTDTSSEKKEVGSSLTLELDYDPYDENIKRVSGYSVTESSAYSPSPIGGWNDTSHSYTPSSIDTLNSQENVYIPSSNNADKELPVKYNPTDKSKESSEPTYVPLGTDIQTGENAMYKPSSVSNSEPEYQPHSEDSTVKQYFPTDISTLDSVINDDILDSFSSEIDLLHEILTKDLDEDMDNDGEDISNPSELRENATNTNVANSKSNLVYHEYKSDLNVQGESRLKDKNNSNAMLTNSDISASKLEEGSIERVQSIKSSDKKGNYGKNSNSSKKKRDFDKKVDSEKNKSDSDKRCSSSNKKHSEDYKSQIDGNKNVKKNAKDNSSRRKHSKSEKKHSESDKNKHESDRKRSENVKRKLNSDKKKDATEKKISDNSKHTSRKLGDVEKHKSVRHANKDIVHTDLSKRHKEHKSKYKSSIDKHLHSHPHIHSNSNCDTCWKSNDAAKIQERRSSSNKLRSESFRSPIKYAESKVSNYSKHQKMLLKCSKNKHHKERKELEEDGDGRIGSVVELSESDEESSDDLHIIDNVTLPSDMGASSSDEDTVTKECFRIFQEYEPAKIHSAKRKLSHTETENENTPQTQIVGKKRVAHEAALISSSGKMRPAKRPAMIHPGEVLANRFQKLKETHSVQLEMSASSVGPSITVHGTPPLGSSTTMASQPLIPPGRVRIAHVPNVSLLLNAKLKMQQKLQEQQLHRTSSTTTSTVAQSSPKGGHRIAHMPAVGLLARPIITNVGGRIPANVRQNYLNIMVDEYLKLCTSDAEAFEKAADEEKSIFSRSTTRTVYSSHMSNTINRLRKSARQDGNSSLATTSKANILNLSNAFGNRTVSHTSVLAGKGGSKGSWSIEKPKKPPPVLLTNLYQEFYRHILSEELLKSNGFPMTHPEEKGVAVIYAFYKTPFVPATLLQRLCCRCSKIYYINKQGFAVEEKPCVYHWGRLFQSKVRSGTWESRYSCCQTDADTSGCMMGPSHVSDNYDPKNMRGFIKTLPKDQPPSDGDYGIYALDCEMCYTTHGLELTRVTVIGTNLETVYETLVKPENPILDYNTRFSGITEEDLMDVTTSIFEVQSALLSFISDKTILVGHSLESDFKALKLIHGTVVDTSVVYPHKLGPPKKRALKSLCRELLHKIIQEGDGGHDSAEDAKTCMEIMLFKLKEDMKTR